MFSSLPPSVVFFHFHFSAAGERIRLSDTMMDICMAGGSVGTFCKGCLGLLLRMGQVDCRFSIRDCSLWLCRVCGYAAWPGSTARILKSHRASFLPHSIFLAKIKNQSHAGWVHIWLLGFLNNSFGKGCMDIPVFKDSCGS